MKEHGTISGPGIESPAGAGRNLGRIAVALFVVFGLGTTLFFLVFSLTLFGFWKGAVAAEILAIGGAAIAWKRRLFAIWLRSVCIATTVCMTVALAVLFRSAWTVQAQHDTRLSGMVAELCAVEVSGGSIQECGGSISNTGNGNSCRYLASATVAGEADSAALASELRAQGFSPTELDQWGNPLEDGRGYLAEGSGVQLFFQSSWQDSEGDFRCT